MEKGGRSAKVEVRDSGVQGLGIYRQRISGINSIGWFAIEDIKKGEIVFSPYPDGSKFDYKLEEILTWERERRRKFFRVSVQVDVDVYNGYHSDTDCTEEQKLDWHLNHSCDPNVWYIDKDLIEARRDISKGEELFYDYATSQANDKMNMKCTCGAKNCRGVIRGDDWKKKELQEAYTSHFLPYIRNLIQQQQNS